MNQGSGKGGICVVGHFLFYILDCGSLSKPENGQVNTQPGTIYQKLASYTCNEGYDLNGTNVRECQADGFWDGTEPVCQIIGILLF